MGKVDFKSRNFSLLREEELKGQMESDASAALRYYGETLDIRRPSLQHLLFKGSNVWIARVRLIYEGGELKPRNAEELEAYLSDVQDKIKGVEVSFQ